MARKLRENPLQAANTHTRSKTCYAVWSNGNGDAIAAAESGTFFHINGGVVSPVSVPTTSDFYDVHGFAPNDVWAVGTFGAIWRFDGTTWTAIEDNPTEGNYDPTWFEAVWGRSSDDLYVCGDNSEILHFDGSEWRYLIKWDRVSHNTYPNRWYSMAGLDDGTLYAVGSPITLNGQTKGGVVRIRPGEDPELLDAPTDTPFINAIERIPNTDELLLCGGKGTLCRIKGNQITKEAEGIVKEDDRLYAIEAIDENTIIVVGWGGRLLRYKDGIWKRLSIPSRPFLEGVAFCGNNMFIAVGWMGRLLSYDLEDNRWTSLYNGRVNETLTLAKLDKQSLVASCGGGNIIVRSSSGDYQQHLPCHCDVNLALGLENGHVLLAGDDGYLAEVSVQANGDLTYLSEDIGQATWDATCGVPVTNNVYLGCSDFAIRKWSSGSVTEINGVRSLLSESSSSKYFTFEALYVLSETTFLARLSGGYNKPLKTYFVDLDNNKAVRLNIAKSEVVVASDNKIWVINREAVWLATDLNQRKQWQKVVEIEKNWISADETISYGTYSDEHLILGGTRGSVLFVDSNNQIVKKHSGSYSEITSMSDANDDVLYVGHKWGRVKRLDLSSGQTEVYSISSPTWWSASSIRSGSLICGQDGAIGVLEQQSDVVDLQPPAVNKDFLCSVEIDSNLMCLAGVETIVLWRESESPVIFSMPNFVFTTANYYDETLYLGTSGGQILSIPARHLQSRQLSSSALTELIEKPLTSPIVDLSIINEGIRAVCFNGQVHLVAGDTEILFDAGDELRRGAIPQNTEDAYFAGSVMRRYSTKPYNRMIVLQANGLRYVENIEMPTKYAGKLLTKEVSAFAQDERKGFWFGGQSGELVIRVNEKWYQVSTGIGNHLQSITTSHDRLMVCGRFGAVRFGKMDIFRARIDELQQSVEAVLETTSALPTKQLTQSEANLDPAERRVLDMFEMMDDEEQFPID